MNTDFKFTISIITLGVATCVLFGIAAAALEKKQNAARDAQRYADWLIYTDQRTIKAVWIRDDGDRLYYSTAEGASGTVSGKFTYERRQPAEAKP